MSIKRDFECIDHKLISGYDSNPFKFYVDIKPDQIFAFTNFIDSVWVKIEGKKKDFPLNKCIAGAHKGGTVGYINHERTCILLEPAAIGKYKIKGTK